MSQEWRHEGTAVVLCGVNMCSVMGVMGHFMANIVEMLSWAYLTLGDHGGTAE